MKEKRIIQTMDKVNDWWYGLNKKHQRVIANAVSALVGILVFGIIGAWLCSMIHVLMGDKSTLGAIAILSFFGFIYTRLNLFFLNVFMKHQRKLSELSYQDELTGLANSRFFKIESKRMAGSARRQKEWIGCLFMDINDFKVINDTHGHDAGDLALINLTHKLQRNVRRDDDLIVRSSGKGDEFVVMIRVSDKEEFLRFREDLQQKLLRNRFNFRDIEIEYSVTIGASVLPAEDTNVWNVVMTEADKDMYIMKPIIKAKVEEIKSSK